MAIDPRDAFKNWLEAYVREVTREQLGYTEGEMDDAAQFLAIPSASDEPLTSCSKCGFIYDYLNNTRTHHCDVPILSIAVLRTARAQLLGDNYNGRWEDLSYSDHAFLYDVGISLDNEDGGSL